MDVIRIDKSATIAFMLLTGLYLLAEFQILTPLTAPLRFSFIAMVLVLGAYLIARKPLKAIELKLIILAVLFQVIYTIRATSYSDGATYTSIAYQAVFLLLAYIVAMIKWEKSNIKILSFSSILLSVILLFVLVTKPELLNFNAAGAYAYLLLFFILLYYVGFKKRILSFIKMLIFSAAPLAVIALSDARSVLLSMLAGLFTWFMWKRITRSRIRFNLYFVAVLVFNYIFTTIYPRIDVLWSKYGYYNALMIQYTGKSILSGREDLWTLLLHLIQQKPFFGYGSGALPRHFLNTTLSAHNLYLQVALQVGLIGLATLLIFLYCIWRTFLRNNQDRRVALAASFFISILVYQLFEVTLTQNNFGITILQWFIIGLGLSFALNKRQEPS